MVSILDTLINHRISVFYSFPKMGTRLVPDSKGGAWLHTASAPWAQATAQVGQNRNTPRVRFSPSPRYETRARGLHGACPEKLPLRRTSFTVSVLRWIENEVLLWGAAVWQGTGSRCVVSALVWRIRSRRTGGMERAKGQESAVCQPSTSQASAKHQLIVSGESKSTALANKNIQPPVVLKT